MKNFLSSTKGKIIAGAVTLLVIAGVIVLIILLNTGYRNIRVADLTGTSRVTSMLSVADAYKGQNLVSGDNVEVLEKSSLTLSLDSDKHVVAQELTKFSLEAFGAEGKDTRTIIHLEKGTISNEIDNKLLPSESYVVESPNASMSVRGTIFTVNVFFDSEGLCHTVVEVEQGVVELTEKGTDKVKTLNAGESASVISRVENIENSSVNSGSNSNNINPGQPENREYVFNDPEILAVEQAIETYLNGGELDTTNFDRIDALDIYGNVAFVQFEDVYGCGKGKEARMNGKTDTSMTIAYEQETGTKEISADLNSLTNLDFLQSMSSLKWLTFSGGKINDISAVTKIRGLNSLSLLYNDISDISPLADLPELVSLDLLGNKISDISALSNCTKLMTLSLCYNEISDISALSDLKNMRSLLLDRNNISDISIVENMPNLSYLSLDGNNITDISYVSSLTNLSYLSFNHNNVSDISALSKINSLQMANMYRNPITDYSPLYNLPNLLSAAVGPFNDDKLQEIQQAMPGVVVS